MISRKQPLFFRNANRGVERMTRSSKSRSKKRRTLLDRLRRQTTTKKRSNLLPGMERLEDRRLLAVEMLRVEGEKTFTFLEPEMGSAATTLAGKSFSKAEDRIRFEGQSNIKLDFSKSMAALSFKVDGNTLTVSKSVGISEVKIGTVEFSNGAGLGEIVGSKNLDIFQASETGGPYTFEIKKQEVTVAGTGFLTLSDVGILRGSNGDDNFIFATTNSNVEIDGREGSDTLSFAAISKSLTFRFSKNSAPPGETTGVFVSSEDGSLVAANFVEKIHGGSGSDSFIFEDDDLRWNGEEVLGNDGIDRLDFSAYRAFATLDISLSAEEIKNWNDRILKIKGFDDVTGGAGHDTITGTNGTNRLEGGRGNDTIRGGGGNDTFVFEGDWGQDRLNPNDDGADTFKFGATSIADAINIDVANAEGAFKFAISRGESTIEGEAAGGFTIPENQLVTDKFQFEDGTVTTLNLSDVLSDLHFEIAKLPNGASETANRISVSAVGSESPNFKATNVDNLTGGEGNNTFVMLPGATLPGVLIGGGQNQEIGKRNILDYSRFGDVNGAAVFANLTNLPVTFDRDSLRALRIPSDAPLQTYHEATASYGELPTQERWVIDTPALEGTLQLSDTSKPFQFGISKLKDEQQFKKSLSALLNRADFSIERQQSQAERKTSWIVKFAEPKPIDEAVRGLVASRVVHQIEIGRPTPGTPTGPALPWNQTVSLPKRDNAGAFALQYEETQFANIDLHFVDVTTEDGFEAIRDTIERGLSNLSDLQFTVAVTKSESDEAYNWQVKLTPKDGVISRPARISYSNTSATQVASNAPTVDGASIGAFPIDEPSVPT
ncbi:MAG: calcium-binding protein [Phycisphaera sp. RhM]|nr:calcium-binding protein [Phycisphaera sp. RhM]